MIAAPTSSPLITRRPKHTTTMLHHLSRGTLALAALLATSLAGTAQNQAELIAKKKEKLAQPWLQKASWTLDYEAAQASAKESGKPIFGYFTRSYAP